MIISGLAQVYPVEVKNYILLSFISGYCVAIKDKRVTSSLK